MERYTDVNGTPFTEEDLERWAAETELEEGFTGKHLGPPRPGRPVSVGDDARPITLRLDVSRREKLQKVAAEQEMTVSEVLRGLIDSL